MPEPTGYLYPLYPGKPDPVVTFNATGRAWLEEIFRQRRREAEYAAKVAQDKAEAERIAAEIASKKEEQRVNREAAKQTARQAEAILADGRASRLETLKLLARQAKERRRSG